MTDDSPALKVDGVRRIAVLRANALGDFIFTLPALGALRRTYPGAEIVLFGRAWHADFLRHRPGPVDRVVEIPRVPGLTAPGTQPGGAIVDHFFDRIARERFDLALQLHGGGRYSNPFVARLNARVTAGFRTPDAAPLDRWCTYNYYQHEVLRYLEAVALVGAVPAEIEPRLPVTQSDRMLADSVLPHDGSPWVLLHPGAGDPRRRWPPESFAAVGDALHHAGATVIINSIDDNAPLARRVRDHMDAPAHLLEGPLSLGAFSGVLSRCRLVVSNDSGPLHLARAVGTATVGIYWCGNVVNAGPLATHRHRTCISWQLHCPECGIDYSKDHCAHEHSLVAAVSAAEATDAALVLLRQSQPDMN